MKRIIGAMLLSTSLLIQSTVSSTAQTPHEYLSQSRFDDARLSLAKLVAGLPNAKLHMAYLEAQILLRQNRPEAAISILREIILKAPNYEPARRELSYILAARGEVAGAIYHAERVIAQTGDERLREQFQSYILNNPTNKAAGYALRFALLPSSNQNRGSEAGEIIVGGVPFAVDPDSRASSGVALAVGITGWRKWQLAERWSGLGSISLDTKFYESALGSETTVLARYSLIHTTKRARLTFGPVIEATFTKSDLARTRLGGEINGTYALRPSHNLNGKLRLDSQRYGDSAYRNGRRALASLSYHYLASPTFEMFIGFSNILETTKRKHLNHKETTISVGVEKQWPSGLISAGTIGLGIDRFEASFPGTSVMRRDRTASLTASFRHAKFKFGEYIPQVSYTYTRAKSNIVLFDHDSHDLSFALSARF